MIGNCHCEAPMKNQTDVNDAVFVIASLRSNPETSCASGLLRRLAMTEFGKSTGNLQVFEKEFGHAGVEVHTGVAAGDAVIAVAVHLHFELFAGLH